MSRLAQDVAYLMSLNPQPEQPVNWEFLFSLVGVEDRATKREVYERIGRWVKLQHEHHEALKPDNLRVVENPHQK